MTLVAVLTGWQHLWSVTAIVVATLALYLLFVRLVRCRVETRKHRPCRWRVRGLCGTCDWHVGDKHGLPTLVHGDEPLSLPKLMWPRGGLGDPTPYRPEWQPEQYGSGARVAPSAQRLSGFQVVTTAISLATLVVGFGSFLLSLLSEVGAIGP